MSSVPPGVSPLRLPLGEIVFYSTGRPCIRVLIHQIADLGYSVSSFPLTHTDFSTLPPGVCHCAVVISDFILFIFAPTVPSTFSDSLSDQSCYGSSSSYETDSDNIDPEDGY